MNLKLSLLIIGLSFASGQDRKIVSKLNPGCQNCDLYKRPLIYIRAEGSNDTIHQLWDFTDHTPTIVYAIGSPNSTLNIIWKDLYPDQFEFSDLSSKAYSFAAAIDAIVEYNDLKDVGHFDPACQHRTWSLHHLTWRLIDSVLTEKEVRVMLRGEHEHKLEGRGSLEMTLDLLPFSDYATDLPHLIHTANSTRIDISLVNWTERFVYNNSRYALRFVVASTDRSAGVWDLNVRKSLDDEHTPGVFEIIEIRSPKSASTGNGGFIQFRPVAYTDSKREVSSSTNAYISNLNRTEFPRDGLMGPFYRYFAPRHHQDPDSIIKQEMIVSFGLSGDGFYKQHNFTSWSFTMGYGSPPLERFSLFVIVIISIGLAVPTLLALSGVIYVVHRRCKQTNAPARFTNDD